MSIGNLTGNIFDDTDVTVSSGNLTGGGVVGMAGTTPALGVLDDTHFEDVRVTSGNDLRGGGVVGAFSFSATAATVGSLTGNTFIGNTITAENDIQGGGIVGAFSGDSSTTTSIGDLSGNEFSGNTVTSTSASIYGGLIYARSLGEIVNNSFTGNTFNAMSGRVFGAVTLDTSSAGSNGNLTVRAENGKETVFDNTTSDSEGTNRQAESLYLGKLTATNSQVDATLTFDAQAGSRIDLSKNPIRVEQDNDKNFTLNVLGNGGEFLWGGKNFIDVMPGVVTGALTFESGSRTYLSEGFVLSGSSNGATNAGVNLSSGAKLHLPVQTVHNLATVPYMAVNTFDGPGLVDLDDRPLAGIGIAEGDVVLVLEDSTHVSRNTTLGTGVLTYGTSTLDYTLAWADTSNPNAYNVIVEKLGAPAYNPGQGGSDPNTGTAALAADPPMPEIARNHLRYFFWNRDKDASEKRLWVDTSFSRTHLRNGSRLGLSYRLETPAVLAGADIHAAENAVAGLAVGISRPQYRGDLAAGRVKYRHDRTVKGEGHKADYRGHNLLAGLEIARPVALENGWVVRPFVSQDYIRQQVGGYTEKGTGEFALTVKGQRRELWVSRLGIGIKVPDKKQDNGWRFAGGGEAYWQGRYGDTAADARVRFHNRNDPAWYESRSERLPRHSLGLGVKAGWSLRDRMHVRLGYDLRVSRHETAHEGSVRVEWNW